MKKKINGKEIGETSFIIIYLTFLLISSFIFLIEKSYYFLLMALILGIGDSFHLIPRIIKNIKGNFKNSSFYLGLGSQISSITMTIFYVLFIFKMYSNDILVIGNITIFLAIIRIILCLFPQNNWYKIEGNQKWALIRNIPFIILGIIAVIRALQNHIIYLAILISLSYLFYLPVALYGKKNKKLGMLMIPKTICYILMIIYFY